MTAGALHTQDASGAPSEDGPAQVAALSLRGVERSWGKREVLKGATLDVPSGTVVWLGGENGAGKTTLLRVASGLILPHAGTVTVFGQDPIRDRRVVQQRLGYLSAGDRGLYARLTVVQNLEFWCGLALVPPRQRNALMERAIDRFGLGELARQRVDRTSMGQRQRVRLAMTFLHEPDLVLLDEPQTSLDERGLELLDGALSELTKRGGGALWCSPTGRNLPLRTDLRYMLEHGVVIRA